MANEPTMSCSVFLGKPITLTKESGKVIDKETTANTIVEGDAVTTNNGRDVHVDVSSTVVNKSQLWLVDKNGKKFTTALYNANLGERKGDMLSIARIKGSSAVAGYNHSMDMYEWWGKSFRDKILKPPAYIFYAIVFLPIVLLWAKYFFTYTTMEMMDVFLYSAGIFMVWGILFQILWVLFVVLRGSLFKAKYASAIESFLKEPISIED